MAWQGIDLLQTGDRIVFRALLQDSAGALITSGSATLKLYELQNDGTLKSYDWNDNTFKTTALTTETQALTHRTGNNGGTNTGLWTYALTTLSGFTAGNLYIALINHSSASPTDQARLFQFGVSAAFDPYDAAAAGLTKFAEIEADTNELQGDLADGGRIDLILDAIAGDVENLDGAAMRGTDGANTATPLDAAGFRAAVGLAAANLDAQLAAIPTNPMLATEDGSSFTAIPNMATATNQSLIAGYIDTEIGAIKAVTDQFVFTVPNQVDANALTLSGGGDATEAKQDSIIALLGTPTDTDIATDLVNLQTAVDGISVGTGDGARTVTVTVDDGTNPLQNATVRMTEGANTYRATTDVNGQCTFNLDDATYTVAITKAGYTYAGSSLVVSGDATPSLSMTQVTITPPTGADTSTGVLECRDQFGAVEEGVNITVQISSGPGTAGYGYDTTYWTETSDASGIVQFPGLIRGATYKLWRGTRLGQGVSFVVPNSDSFNLAEVLGAP